jgi:hypothetical protein
MFGTILAFLTGLGPVVSAITTKITDLKIAKLKAETDVQRIEIQAQIEDARSKQAVLVAEAGNRIAGIVNSSFRVFLAIPAAAFLYKVLLWDKVVGSLDGCAVQAGKAVGKTVVGGIGPEHIRYCQEWYRTDGIDPNMWWFVLAVIGFYFVTSTRWKR